MPVSLRSIIKKLAVKTYQAVEKATKAGLELPPLA